MCREGRGGSWEGGTDKESPYVVILLMHAAQKNGRKIVIWSVVPCVPMAKRGKEEGEKMRKGNEGEN